MDKRLYVPEALSSASDVRAAVQDMYALLCIYLVQEEFVSLEEGGDVQAFLYGYLRQFKGAMQVGIPYALAELLAHYQIPEDYRAVRKYVAKTIRGLLANQRRQEELHLAEESAAVQTLDRPEGRDDNTAILDDWEEHTPVPRRDRKRPAMPDLSTNPGLQMIPAAAAALGMSVRTLYALVAQGKVQTETVIHGRRPYITVSEAEMERLKGWLEQKRWRKALIEGLAAAGRITIASARRWVERQEAKGFGSDAIGQQVRERLQRLKHSEELED